MLILLYQCQWTRSVDLVASLNIAFIVFLWARMDDIIILIKR